MRLLDGVPPENIIGMKPVLGQTIVSFVGKVNLIFFANSTLNVSRISCKQLPPLRATTTFSPI